MLEMEIKLFKMYQNINNISQLNYIMCYLLQNLSKIMVLPNLNINFKSLFIVNVKLYWTFTII